MTSIKENLRCNEQIRVSPVRLIGAENEQLGIISNTEAMHMAREQGLDLVEVAPNVRPPVCRLMNYGKWKYLQKKNSKKSHEQQIKEVRLRPKTDTHDRQIKYARAVRFLKKGHKVQFTMIFRGRERSHREIGFATFQSIVDELAERVKVERRPSIDGRLMVMVVAPIKGAFDELPDDDIDVEDVDVDVDVEAEAELDGDEGEQIEEASATKQEPAEVSDPE